MFNQETIFILGAGASWHYGYPTGEELVLDVVEIAKSLRGECERQLKSEYAPAVPDFVTISHPRERLQYWSDLQRQCDDLVRRLETVRPLVIDYFLGWNPSLRDIGRLLIAAVMLKCEAEYFAEKANVNRRPNADRSIESPTAVQVKNLNISAFRDNWYRFVTHRLVSKCVKSADLFENKIHFITFNYDFSLEEHLFKSLRAIDIFDAADIEKFLGANRVIHVYGCIRDHLPADKELEENGFMTDRSLYNWVGLYDSGPYKSKWPAFLAACNHASSKIKTIDPHDKVDDSVLSVAKGWVAKSEVAYLLGYGFDETNSERIGLTGLATAFPNRRVYFREFQRYQHSQQKGGPTSR